MDNEWKEYEHLTELYKSYLSIMVNLGVFSFAAIGGVSSFVLSSVQGSNDALHWVIIMPFLFSLGLASLYFKSIIPAKELEAALKKLGYQKLKVEVAPHAYLLVFGVRLLAWLYFLIAVGLLMFFFQPQSWA